MTATRTAPPDGRRDAPKARAAATPRQEAPDISKLLSAAASEHRSDSDYYQHALALITGWLDAPLALLDVRVGAQTLELQQLTEPGKGDQLVPALQALLLDTESSRRTSIRELPEDKLLLLSVPVDHPRMGAAGALVVALPPSQSTPQQRLRELQSIATLVTSVRAARQAAPQVNNVQKALERASKYDNVREFAYSLVNSLAQRLRCQQVSLGILKQDKIQLEAISGLDRFKNSSPHVTQLRQAMEECADAGQSILAEQGGPMRLHTQLQQRTNTAVLSIPLCVDGQCTAVVTLQRDQGSFGESEIPDIETMTNAFAPAVHLLKRMNQTPTRKAVDSARHWMLANAAARRTLLVAALILGVVAFLFGSLPYRLRCDGALAPNASRVVAAPFDGALAELLVRPGDRITAGQVVARLDSDLLLLERQRLMSELNIKRLSAAQHLEDRESDLASMVMAQSESLAAQIATVQRQLDLAEVRSPVDGVVLRGDWEKHVGQNVAHGQTLVEVGDRMTRVEIFIPERLAPEVSVGMTAKFTPLSDPGHSAVCRITRVGVAAEPRSGESVVRAEAEFETPQAWSIAGMEGVTRVDGGSRPIWWLSLHRIIQWFQRGLA